MQTAWLLVFGSGLLEIVWALCIKRSDGCRRVAWTVAGILIAVLSIVLLAQAMRRLPAATSYAVWAGVGAAGTFLVSVLFLQESASFSKVISLLLIIAGIIGLRLDEGDGSLPPLPPVAVERR